MKRQDIQNIWLGPRQLSFNFENSKPDGQATVLACLESQIEKNGYANFDECVQHVKEKNEMSDAAIIQHIFWLAQDLKVHFRLDGAYLKPSEVKKALLQSVERQVIIVPNKSVDNAVFQNVKQLYSQLSGETGAHNCDDQYEFARSLASTLRDWRLTLKSYESVAQKPFFPYAEEIQDCIGFVNKISAKLDSFSLIHTFYNDQVAIQNLSDDVREISEFYLNHLDFWKGLVESFEDVYSQLSQLGRNPDIFGSTQALKQVLSAPAPHKRIPEAKKLLKKMMQQYRAIVSEKLDDLIVSMKAHLNASEAESNLRNRSLYFLRTSKKRICQANDIKTIHHYLIDAEEKFEFFRDEIELTN